MRWLVVVVGVALLVGGCGASPASRFEEAIKEAHAAHRRFEKALKGFEESSTRYNETLNREWREHPTASLERTCAHLRAHQLHSKNRTLAQEAADYLREEC